MPVGKGGTLGDDIAVDKLSVGRDMGVAVETTPACTGRHADNERDRRKTEMRTGLKNNLDRIGHLCYSVIYRLFIIDKPQENVRTKSSFYLGSPYAISRLHSLVKSNGNRYLLDGGCKHCTLFIPFELYKEFIDVITTRSWNIRSYFGMNNDHNHG